MLVPPRVAACTAIGALTPLTLHSVIPTFVWLLCISFSMPGKRSWVNAVPGSMTPDQIRRQARDCSFLPQPPPPPLPKAPRRTAWEDVVDTCETATQCDSPFAAVQGEPPLSGKVLDTINRALGIIELQSRPCPASPIEVQPKQTIRQLLLEPLIVDFGCTPGFPPLDDAPFTKTEISNSSCLPPAPLLEDAPLALKEVSYYANTEQLTGSFYIGDDYATSAYTAALEERIAKLDFDYELIILGNIQIDKRVSALENEVGDEGGDVAAAADVDQAPFSAAQLLALGRDINSTVMEILEPMIDLVIGKVEVLVETNVKNMLAPVCMELNCRIDAMEELHRDDCDDGHGAAEPLYQNVPCEDTYDESVDSSIVQNCMLRRYCFQRNVQTSMHGCDLGYVEADLAHNSLMHMQDNNSIHRLHVESSFQLVRYFEKMVEDEFNAPNQIDTGETLHDCTDFDELKNDLHSTAACAQLLRQTLPGSNRPTQ